MITSGSQSGTEYGQASTRAANPSTPEWRLTSTSEILYKSSVYVRNNYHLFVSEILHSNIQIQT